MLPKRLRASRKEVERAFISRSLFRYKHVTLRFHPHEKMTHRFAVSVPKKVTRTAVDRIRQRRQWYVAIRSVYMQQKETLPNGIYVIVPHALFHTHEERSAVLTKLFEQARASLKTYHQKNT